MKSRSVIVLSFVLLLSLGFEVSNANLVASPKPTENMPEIFIREDGSIDPEGAPIQRNGRIYSLTGDIVKYCLIIRCDNIIFDGKGHTLLGRGIVPGVDTAITIMSTPFNSSINRKNVTIMNVNIEEFRVGIQAQITGCTITRNTFTNVQSGIMVDFSNHQITNNTIKGKLQDYGCGISAFGSHNSVMGNDISHLRCGIEFKYGDHNRASNNTLSNIAETAIDISSAPDTVLEKNVLPVASPSPTALSATPSTPAQEPKHWSNSMYILLGLGVIAVVVSLILLVIRRHLKTKEKQV
jgi:parallel beta-helix repeat protein